jgi:hypothetical protein
VAWDNEELLEFLKDPASINSKMSIGAYASGPLVNAIREFIDEN